MTRLAFIDTETTGLDDRRHEIWEVALIIRDDASVIKNMEYLWQLPVGLENADPIALNIGKFHDRRYDTLPLKMEYAEVMEGIEQIEAGTAKFIVPESGMGKWAQVFTTLTRNAFLVGNVISFDEERLRKLLRDWDQCPMWNYHLVDVETLAAGKLGLQPPWRGNTVSEALGVPVPGDQHSALADARWAMQMYDRALEIPGDW